MDISFKDKKENGRLDLESIEMHIRSSMQGMGRNMLEQLLNEDNGYRGRTFSCGEGSHFEFVGYREKEFLTVLGEVTIKRAYYYDEARKRGVFPRERRRWPRQDQGGKIGMRIYPDRFGCLRAS